MIRRMLLLALVLVVSCEPARSQRPLSDPSTAKVDARLVGAWSGKIDQRAVFLHFSAHKDGQMDVVLVGEDDNDGAGVLHYQGHETLADGAIYLNLRQKTFTDPYAEKFTLGADWIFAKVELSKDGKLTIAWMDEKPVRDAIAAGTLKGNDRTIDDEPAKILAFIKGADAKKLWSPLAASFRRVKP